ncbi:hypothetical protein [Streptomyces sp. NBC_01317]|uniref:hypothetical protein n=1 Tax=Streptomyces sp. NBC_01317 TaxID=2903822 RepID=UPI003FA3C4F1
MGVRPEDKPDDKPGRTPDRTPDRTPAAEAEGRPRADPAPAPDLVPGPGPDPAPGLDVGAPTDAARSRRRAQFLRELNEAKALQERVKPRRARAARMRQQMRMRTFRW